MTIATFSLGTLGTSLFDLKATDSCLVIIFFSELHAHRTTVVEPVAAPTRRTWT